MENKKLVVANWKATKTIKETVEWVKKAKETLEKASNIEIVICAPFTSLQSLKSLLLDSNLKVGAQDVSKFTKGAYTGEVTIEMLDGLVDYCIIGHSERRKYFGETDDGVIEKVKNLLSKSITPVLCVSDMGQLDSYIDRGRIILDNAEKLVFVYEPPRAISGGKDYHPESPNDANKNIQAMKGKIGKSTKVLYGGSANPDNVKAFCDLDSIDGVLPGQASTDPAVFTDLISKIS